MGPSSIVGMELLSKFWLSASQEVAQRITPERVGLVRTGSGIGLAASLFARNPYLAALCTASGLSAHYIGHAHEQYINGLQYQLQQALHKKEDIKPIIDQFSQKKYVSEERLKTIVAPLVDQHNRQVAGVVSEVQQLLTTTSPCMAYRFITDTAQRSRFPYDAYDKALALVSERSCVLLKTFSKKIETDAHSGEIIQEHNYKAQCDQLLPEDQQRLRDAFKRERDKQIQAQKALEAQNLQKQALAQLERNIRYAIDNNKSLESALNSYRDSMRKLQGSSYDALLSVKDLVLSAIEQQTEQLKIDARTKLQTMTPSQVNLIIYSDERYRFLNRYPFGDLRKYTNQIDDIICKKSEEILLTLLNEFSSDVQQDVDLTKREKYYNTQASGLPWSYEQKFKKLFGEALDNQHAKFLKVYAEGAMAFKNAPYIVRNFKDAREFKKSSVLFSLLHDKTLHTLLMRLIKDYATSSPLHKWGIKDLAKALIEHGVNPYIKDTADNNPIRAAQDMPEQDSEVISNILLATRHSPPVDMASINSDEAPTMLEVFIDHYRNRGTTPYGRELLAWLSNRNNIHLFRMYCHEKELTAASREAVEKSPYCVFYHAHKGSQRLIQDIGHAILQFEQQETINSFIPLRFWHNGQKDSDAIKFILDHGMNQASNSSKINDGADDIRQHLLSVNLSFLSNLLEAGCSTIQYYRENYSMQAHSPTLWLQNVCAYYDFNASIITRLLEQIGALNIESRGSVVQIFIPRQYVDQVVYLAIAFGSPYKTDLGFEGFEMCGSVKSQRKITPIIDSIRKGTFIDRVNRQGLSGPQRLETLQARIVLGQDVMLNYKSGVKIFRIDNASSDARKQYIQYIDNFCRSVFIDWLERILQQNPDGTCGVKQEALDRIKDTPLGKLVQDRDQVRALLQKLRAEVCGSAIKVVSKL